MARRKKMAEDSRQSFDHHVHQPKTDYTYSQSLSYRERVTPDRRIGSPNMSRRPLHGSHAGYQRSKEFSSPRVPDKAGGSAVPSSSVARKLSMDDLSDTSDIEESEGLVLRNHKKVGGLAKANGSSTSFATMAVNRVTKAKTLSFGLDEESDVEDGTSKVIRRVNPIVGRRYKVSAIGHAVTAETATEKATQNWSRNFTKERMLSIISWVYTMVIAPFLLLYMKLQPVLSSRFSNSADDQSSVSKVTKLHQVFTYITKISRVLVRTSSSAWHWYRAKAQQNVFLVCWVPLLLLLLLTFGAYLWLVTPDSHEDSSDARSASSSFSSVFYSSFITLYNAVADTFLTSLYWVYSCLSSCYYLLSELLARTSILHGATTLSQFTQAYVDSFTGFIQSMAPSMSGFGSAWVAFTSIVSMVMEVLLYSGSILLSALICLLQAIYSCYVAVVSAFSQVLKQEAEAEPAMFSEYHSAKASVTSDVKVVIGDADYQHIVDSVTRRILDSGTLQELIRAMAIQSHTEGVHSQSPLHHARSSHQETSTKDSSGSLMSEKEFVELLHRSDVYVTLKKVIGQLLESSDFHGYSNSQKAELLKMKEEIEALRKDVENLEGSHDHLSRDLKDVIATSADVEHHILHILMDVLSVPVEQRSSHRDVWAWLNSYYVAKSELEKRMQEVAKKNMEDQSELLRVTLAATREETTHAIMETVLQEIRAELKKNREESQLVAVRQSLASLDDSILRNISQLESDLQRRIHDLSKGISSMKEELRAELLLAINASIKEQIESLKKSLASTVETFGPDTASSGGHIDASSQSTPNLTVVSSSTHSVHHLSSGLNESQVAKIVRDAIRVYDADKTGMVDHALESGGGNVVSTRCTEDYQVRNAELSILGFSVYGFSTNTPRTIIQPGAMPGQCWAFKGSQGYIVIRLAGPVRLTGFTLEHIPRMLAPTGEISSAPKDFSVLGLKSVHEEGTLIGKYSFSQHGEPLQYFAVREPSDIFYPYVELQVHSNHGNLLYTCVYRFRVHGTRGP